MPELHETRMGQVFYQKTLPELVTQLTRIADALEKNLQNQEATNNDELIDLVDRLNK